MTAAACQHNPPDCTLAHETRPPLTAIDAMLELKKSFFAIHIHVIGNRRSAERDRLTKHFPHGSVQLAHLLPAKGGRPPAGTNSRPEQCLIGVNITDTPQQLLIQERALDRSLAPAKQRDELLLTNFERLHSSGIEAA